MVTPTAFFRPAMAGGATRPAPVSGPNSRTSWLNALQGNLFRDGNGRPIQPQIGDKLFIFHTGITINLGGNVLGNGACAPGEDCFVQNLFITSDDPIDIPAGSTGTTFDLGDIYLGMHTPGDVITVIAKGGPDSLVNGSFPNPAFAETSAEVRIISPVPESAPIILCLLSVGWFAVTGWPKYR